MPVEVYGRFIMLDFKRTYALSSTIAFHGPLYEVWNHSNLKDLIILLKNTLYLSKSLLSELKLI